MLTIPGLERLVILRRIFLLSHLIAFSLRMYWSAALEGEKQVVLGRAKMYCSSGSNEYM
jgi:hypothetical protein